LDGLKEKEENKVAWKENLLFYGNTFCEAQGKGRAKGQPRKVTQRSFIDGGWWMVDILFLMLYIKFGCHPPASLLISRIKPLLNIGQLRVGKGYLMVTVGQQG